MQLMYIFQKKVERITPGTPICSCWACAWPERVFSLRVSVSMRGQTHSGLGSGQKSEHFLREGRYGGLEGAQLLLFLLFSQELEKESEEKNDSHLSHHYLILYFAQFTVEASSFRV